MNNLEMLDTSRTSLRIKCTVPWLNENVANRIHNSFSEALEKLNKYYRVISMTNPIQVKETFEFVFEVEPSLACQKALLSLMQIFLKLVKIQEFRRDMMPVILVSSPHFFSDSCIPDHANIPIQSLYFGNIINSGTLGVHWTVEFYNTKFSERDRVKDKIKVNFEHDRGTVSIKYECTDKDRKTSKIQKVEYTVKFYLNAIRRIIIDPLSIDSIHDNDYKFRFHFELNCPPEMRSFIDVKGGPDKRFGDGNRLVYLSRGVGVDGEVSEKPHKKCVAECTVVSLEFDTRTQKTLLFEILSRLRMRAGVPIEFACMDLLNLYWGGYKLMSPYVEDPLESPAYLERIEWATPSDPHAKPGTNNVSAEQFRLRYIIEALLSRGAKVKDQLLVNVEAWTTFLDVVCKQYKRDAKKTLIVMENVMNRIDEIGFPMISIFTILYEEFVAYDEMKKLNDAQIGFEARDLNMERDGYVKVRKVVITPSRCVYIAPEQIMGNRILRKYYKTETEILRVTLRDDDTQPLRPNTTGEALTKKTAEEALRDGIKVGGRNFRYLGSSNSQMRDNGCYFVYDKVPTYKQIGEISEWTPSKRVKTIRSNMGRLDELTNVAKFMARMGQCFTQSKAVNTGLPFNTSNFTFDVAGGDSAGNDGDMYTFSDGVGQISVEYMKKISKDLKLPNYPCVIQFRHRGYKGVLSLYPPLDDLNRLWKKLDLIWEEDRFDDHGKKLPKPKDQNGDLFMPLNIRFRYSQKKFHAAREEDFEVVKISGPTPVCLNKPFINILDQVSEMQSRDCHLRLCDRVEELLHRQLRMMAETLIREKSCRDKLKELPRRVSIDGLSRQYGFSLSTEPYFRSLLKAAVRYMIKKQLNKEQIQIPLDLGRSMFGVVDETGLLQYGQIFVQYHVNMNDKTPKPSASKIIRTGPTLITKNPCISAGDVRMFDAVDIPALRHLVDVVVFPMHGPRPHPDEMAGSDLDGDEYSVIWDPKLFLERNEIAMKFPKGATKAVKLNMDTLDEDVRKFFIDYITQDSVGMIANAHLNNSDLWGLESKVAKEVAYKHSQAVDFPKTSVAPEALTKDWTETKIGDGTIDWTPPQRAHRKPDFMQSNRDPVYASSRLIGRIYREIGHVDNVLALSEERDQQEDVSIDSMIDEKGWEKYKDVALSQMIIYNNEIKALMERYGISSEGELMSGCMISIRNAISDREADDMSFFNTNLVIETQITQIVRTHRENFFKEFGNIKELTMVAMDRKNVSDETDNIFDRQVSSPSDAMRQKAVALYKVTYDYVSKQRDSSARLLSFPWIAYDVLAEVRSTNVKNDKEFIAGLEPVDEMLSVQVRQYALENSDQFRSKMASWTGRDGKGNGEEAVIRYLNYYDGLGELAFFFVRWAEHEKISMRHLGEIHIVLLLIQFCLGCYDELEAVIIPIAPGTLPLSPRIRLVVQGKVVLTFLRWLSSRSFHRMKYLTFEKPDLNVEGCFMRGEWKPLHFAAIKSFYDLIFSLRIDLPSDNEKGRKTDPPPIIREMNPFVVELPRDSSVVGVANMIKEQTGATEVRLRRLNTGDQTRVVICATGTLLSHSKIRQLLIVPLDIKTSNDPKQMSDKFPEFILAKITDGFQRMSDVDTTM